MVSHPELGLDPPIGSVMESGRDRGTPRETPTVSNLVVAMSIEELRSFSQVPSNIRLEVADGPTATTIRGVDNVVYFTRE